MSTVPWSVVALSVGLAILGPTQTHAFTPSDGVVAIADTATTDSSVASLPTTADSMHIDPARPDTIARATPTAAAVVDSAVFAPLDSHGGRRMQDTVTVIRGITVRGQRAPTGERSTATTLRLDRSAIARFLPSTASDAMASAPGVELIKTGPWASRVSFRGFQGERLLVMVDGVRLNTGRGHGSNTSLVSVDQLDAVDLEAGAAGAEYGSDAMGGVINLVTHRPLFAAQPSLTMRLSARGSEPGDDYTHSGRLALQSPRFGAELNLGQAHQNELVTARAHVPNSGSHDGDLRARAAWKLGEATFDLEHARHASRDVGLPALDGSYPLISRDADRAEIELPFKAMAFGRELPLRAHLLGSDQRYHTDFDETVLDTVISPRTHQPIAYHNTSAQDRIVTRSQGVQPELRFGDKGQLRWGGEWRRETTSGPKTTTVTTTSSTGEVTDMATGESENVPNARRDVRAGSVAARFAVGMFKLEGGARYDWIRSRAESTATSWSPALAVVDQRWSVDGGLALHVGAFEPYGRIASGFRAPNLEERYYRGPIHGALDVFGDPSLVPERNMSYEAGMRAEAGDWGTMRISAYRTQSDDFITLKYLLLVGGRPRFTYANIARAQIDGLEFTGRARIRSTSTQVSVTLPRGRDLSTGNPLTDVGAPRVISEFMTPVGSWLPTGRLALRATWSNGIKSDPQRLTPESELLTRPAFWVANAEFATTIVGTRATLVVYNLFNNPYREPLSFIDEPGRTFTFALKRDFQLPVFESRSEPVR
jgi:hemoglobin/transferrin/lactoferrin receptor protein